MPGPTPLRRTYGANGRQIIVTPNPDGSLHISVGSSTRHGETILVPASVAPELFAPAGDAVQ